MRFAFRPSGLSLTRWPCSASEYWNSGTQETLFVLHVCSGHGVETKDLVPTGVHFQCICFQKDPSAFQQWPGFPLLPSSLSQRKLILNTYLFPWSPRKKTEFVVLTVVPCNLRSLMWSLSKLKNPGGNIFTMLVILRSTWIQYCYVSE